MGGPWLSLVQRLGELGEEAEGSREERLVAGWRR